MAAACHSTHTQHTQTQHVPAQHVQTQHVQTQRTHTTYTNTTYEHTQTTYTNTARTNTTRTNTHTQHAQPDVVTVRYAPVAGSDPACSVVAPCGCPASGGQGVRARVTQPPTDGVGGRVEAVLGRRAVGAGQQPGDDGRLLAVLVLQEAADLRVVDVALQRDHRHDIPHLVVDALSWRAQGRN